MTGSVIVGGAGETSAGGAWVLDPLAVYNSGSVGGAMEEPIVQGDVTISVPAGAVGVVVVLPVGAPPCRIRTNANSGDGGLPINSAGLASPLGPTAPTPLVYPLGPGVNQLILNFAAAFPSEAKVTFV